MNKRNRLDGVQIFALVVCIFACIVCLYPMYYVLIMSISDPTEAAKGVYFLPKKIFFGGYKLILEDKDLWNGLKNSLIYVAATTIGMLTVSYLLSYSLSRKKMFARKLAVIYILIPMYFGGGMIPSYLNMVKLHLNNTRFALILPALCNISYTILMTTYLRSLPHELEEAAVVDGAGHLTIMSRILLPLSKPVLAVVAIYQIVNEWNAWFSALVYVTDFSIHPVQLYLRRILVSNANYVAQLLDKGVFTEEQMKLAVMLEMSTRQVKYAIIMVVTLPIICVYPFFQKYFVKGVMLGSLKG